MTDDASTTTATDGAATSTWTPPPPPMAPQASGPAVLAERPELAAGGAFAGGLVLALILKRLAR